MAQKSRHQLYLERLRAKAQGSTETIERMAAERAQQMARQRELEILRAHREAAKVAQRAYHDAFQRALEARP